jgi:hypothetical protein
LKTSSGLPQVVESGRLRVSGSAAGAPAWLDDPELLRKWAVIFLEHFQSFGDDAFVGAHNFQVPYAAVHYLLGDTLYSSPARYKPGDVLDLGPSNSELTGERWSLRAHVLRAADRAEVRPNVAHFLAYPGLYWIRLD